MYEISERNSHVVFCCCLLRIGFFLPFWIIWRMIEPIGVAWMVFVFILWYYFFCLFVCLRCCWFWCWTSDAIFPLQFQFECQFWEEKAKFFISLVEWNMPTGKVDQNNSTNKKPHTDTRSLCVTHSLAKMKCVKKKWTKIVRW